MVLTEIQKEDISVIEHLEHIWETSLDEVVQSRIELAIQKIQFNDTKEKIQNWVSQENIDLFEGFFLISRYHYPELKLKPVISQLENIRKEIWVEYRSSMSLLEKITILNHIFFDHFKFQVDLLNPNSPQLNHINRVLETKKCNPVSIAIMYILVARSLNLPVGYVDLPRSPLVALFDRPISADDTSSENTLLFYINPTNKGAVIGPREIEYIFQMSAESDREILARRCSDRMVIKRLIGQLIISYNLIGAEQKLIYLNEIEGLL
jgi:regulator of sirC expression with transglutaminase-like and TPR domain